MIRFCTLLTLTVLWFIFMTWLSHQNGTGTSETSRRLAEELGVVFHTKDINKLNSRLRRIAHVVVFMVLTVLVLNTIVVGNGGKKEELIAFLFLICWAVLDEATKPIMEKIGLISGRHFSCYDVCLNWIGVGIGGISVWAIMSI